MTDRELMQQALEALELLAWYENPATKVQVRKPRNGGSIVTIYPHKVATEAAAPLRERLAQPEQEPVAWVCYGASEKHDIDYFQDEVDAIPVGTQLYASPPAQRQPLTEEEIDDIWNRYCDEMGEASINDACDIARAIEAAHGIGEKK